MEGVHLPGRSPIDDNEPRANVRRPRRAWIAAIGVVVVLVAAIAVSVRRSELSVDGAATRRGAAGLRIDGATDGSSTSAGTDPKAQPTSSGVSAAGGDEHSGTDAMGAPGGVSSSASSSTGSTPQQSSSVVLELSPDRLIVGQPLDLVATISVGSAPATGGSVTFLDGTTVLGSTPSYSRSSTLSVAALAVGPHSIVARYSGAGSAGPSTSLAVAVTVDPLWFAPPALGQPNSHPRTIASFSGRGPTMGLLGDSITDYSAPTFASRAIATGHSVSVTGLFGYELAVTKPWIDLYAVQAPRVMIVNLGTNDATAVIEPANSLFAFKERMAATISAFTRSCFVVTTITTHRSGAANLVRNATAASFNAYLRANFAHVADWDAVVAGHPEYLPDGIHPIGSPDGIAALVNTQLAAAQSCR